MADCRGFTREYREKTCFITTRLGTFPESENPPIQIGLPENLSTSPGNGTVVMQNSGVNCALCLTLHSSDPFLGNCPEMLVRCWRCHRAGMKAFPGVLSGCDKRNI